MNNGQVTGHVNFYHALEQARGKSVSELTAEVSSYERRAENVGKMGFFRRLFAYVGDPERHIINQSVLSEKRLESSERPLEVRASE